MPRTKEITKIRKGRIWSRYGLASQTSPWSQHKPAEFRTYGAWETRRVSYRMKSRTDGRKEAGCASHANDKNGELASRASHTSGNGTFICMRNSCHACHMQMKMELARVWKKTQVRLNRSRKTESWLKRASRKAVTRIASLKRPCTAGNHSHERLEEEPCASVANESKNLANEVRKDLVQKIAMKRSYKNSARDQSISRIDDDRDEILAFWKIGI